MLTASGVAAILALVLSFSSHGLASRRIARISLWLALAALPASVLWDFFGQPSGMGDDAGAPLLARAISHVTRYGALALPFAGLAMIAMKRGDRAVLRAAKRVRDRG